MSAAKRDSRSKQARTRRQAVEALLASEERPSPWLASVAIALFVARLLVPAEDAANGGTLWLTQCWLLLAVFWIWDAFRRGCLKFRPDRFDLCVGILVAGHVISALYVFVEGGQKRAALNMLWEWVGLGVSVVLIRQLLRSRDDVRRFLWGLTAIVGVLAVQGLYQHYVWYPQTVEWYESRRSELDRLLRETDDNRERIQELRKEFIRADVPLEGRDRELFENRLLDSTEPFAMFALANTFAGLLAVLLIPILAVVVFCLRQRRAWYVVAGCALPALLIGYCLLLTKSRTAWAGLLAGLFVWACFRWNRGERRRFVVWGFAAAAVAGTILVAAVAVATGGLDRNSLAGAPRSLQFRVQYWTGTFGVLRERPIFGTGPGNFRQHYLKHKAPESSEEIRDPHNLFLDAWCSGGLTALAGLLLLIAWGTAWLVKSGRRQFDAEDDNPRDGPPERAYGIPVWIIGAMGGPLLVLAANWILVRGFDASLPALLAGIALCLAMTFGAFSRGSISPACIAGAWTALLVHLLGAGGIEMPAIAQLLLILPAMLSVSVTGAGQPRAKSQGPMALSSRPSALGPWPGRPTPVIVWLAAATTACGVCLITATYPVQISLWHVEAGRFEAAVSDPRSLAAAQRYFQSAALADPFSPEPSERSAALALRRWWASGSKAEQLFTNAIKYQRTAIELNPNNSRGYNVLGTMHAARFAISGNPADAEEAITAFREALQRYPNHSSMVAQLAVLLSTLPDRLEESKGAAQRAIDLDDVNRREGHRDRFLQDKLRRKLKEILRKK